MKKLTVFFVSFVLLLSGCTVQTTLNPSLFIERFMQKYPEFDVEKDGMFYDGDKSVVFIENQSGRRFAMEMAVDSADRVQKISLACVETDKANELYYLSECIAETYAPEEDFVAAAKMLFGGENYSYHETRWYYYCFSQNETGLYFCIENKRFAPQKEEHLTLRENETLISVR